MNRDHRWWPRGAQPCTTKESGRARARQRSTCSPSTATPWRRRTPSPAYYAEDITLTFANNPTVTGRASALAAISVMPNRSGRCTPTWSTYERRRRRHLRVRRYLALFTAAARSQSKPARCSLCWTASSSISGSTSQRPGFARSDDPDEGERSREFSSRGKPRGYRVQGMAWTG